MSKIVLLWINMLSAYTNNKGVYQPAIQLLTFWHLNIFTSSFMTQHVGLDNIFWEVTFLYNVIGIL